MDPAAQLGLLIDLAESLGITVRRAPSSGESDTHPGGALVRLKGAEMLFLDPTAPLEDQIAVAAAALRGRQELADRFLAPEIRQLIDGPGEDGLSGRRPV